ncbi:MAG: hypothetical protein IJC41_02880 [Firmicutes bacterium]|nr:hypothetical protein [Clostridiales bacterium]MBQ4339925.1 hypothetical protein [Bacillota bacterium]
MGNEKIQEFTTRADIMLHKMQIANELLKRSDKLSCSDTKLSLTDLKTISEIGQTVSLAMELFPDESVPQKETINNLVKSLKKMEDLDIAKMMQLMSLFNAL